MCQKAFLSELVLLLSFWVTLLVQGEAWETDEAVIAPQGTPAQQHSRGPDDCSHVSISHTPTPCTQMLLMHPEKKH